MTAPPLLLIEDTASLQLIYQSVLQTAGHQVVTADNGAEGLAAFTRFAPAAVILDLMLPDRDGIDLMKEILAMRPGTPVIVITANGSITKAVEAMRAGAHEFIIKPFDEQRFLNAVSNALSSVPRGRTTHPAPLPSQFVGTSPVMLDVYAKINAAAPSMATVFITGESGTGKELCAQAIHDRSNRARGPFVPLNCGAIPSELLESEVFGHMKGSFTGAIADKPGAAAMADGGTLFLDEICELDPNLQTKLLRFLQTSTIQPVGANRPRKINTRIICATNRDPLEAVRLGHFREDLYYRLHVVPIQMPPLRRRGADIITIAETALRQFSDEEGRSFERLDDEVRACFAQLPWPGNVRQLLNVIRQVVVMNDATVVTKAMLPDELHLADAPRAIAPGARPQTAPALPLDDLIGLSLAAIERRVIEDTLARHGGSVSKAARVLEVAPSTLYRKIEGWAKPGTPSRES